MFEKNTYIYKFIYVHTLCEDEEITNLKRAMHGVELHLDKPHNGLSL